MMFKIIAAVLTSLAISTFCIWVVGFDWVNATAFEKLLILLLNQILSWALIMRLSQRVSDK